MKNIKLKLVLVGFKGCKPGLQTRVADQGCKPGLQTGVANQGCKPGLQTRVANQGRKPEPLKTLPESGEILNIIIKQFYPKNPSLFCDITSNSQFESLFDFTEKIANRK